jgi:hypothetical protein
VGADVAGIVQGDRPASEHLLAVQTETAGDLDPIIVLEEAVEVGHGAEVEEFAGNPDR